VLLRSFAVSCLRRGRIFAFSLEVTFVFLLPPLQTCGEKTLARNKMIVLRMVLFLEFSYPLASDPQLNFEGNGSPAPGVCTLPAAAFTKRETYSRLITFSCAAMILLIIFVFFIFWRGRPPVF